MNKINKVFAMLLVLALVISACNRSLSSIAKQETDNTTQQEDSLSQAQVEYSASDSVNATNKRRLTNDEARDILEDYFEKKANNLLILYMQAQTSLMSGRNTQAMEYIDASLNLLDYEQGQLLKMMIHFEKGDEIKAQKSFEQAMEMSVDTTMYGTDQSFREFLKKTGLQ